MSMSLSTPSIILCTSSTSDAPIRPLLEMSNSPLGPIKQTMKQNSRSRYKRHTPADKRGLVIQVQVRPGTAVQTGRTWWTVFSPTPSCLQSHTVCQLFKLVNSEFLCGVVWCVISRFKDGKRSCNLELNNVSECHSKHCYIRHRCPSASLKKSHVRKLYLVQLWQPQHDRCS